MSITFWSMESIALGGSPGQLKSVEHYCFSALQIVGPISRSLSSNPAISKLHRQTEIFDY